MQISYICLAVCLFLIGPAVLTLKCKNVWSLLSVLKIASNSVFDASVRVPLHSIENELARKQNYGKS